MKYPTYLKEKLTGQEVWHTGKTINQPVIGLRL
jgi:hypothetical protein